MRGSLATLCSGQAGQYPERAAAVHRAFIERRPQRGGCADLLAIILSLDALETGP